MPADGRQDLIRRLKGAVSPSVAPKQLHLSDAANIHYLYVPANQTQTL